LERIQPSEPKKQSRQQRRAVQQSMVRNFHEYTSFGHRREGRGGEDVELFGRQSPPTPGQLTKEELPSGRRAEEIGHRLCTRCGCFEVCSQGQPMTWCKKKLLFLLTPPPSPPLPPATNAGVFVKVPHHALVSSPPLLSRRLFCRLRRLNSFQSLSTVGSPGNFVQKETFVFAYSLSHSSGVGWTAVALRRWLGRQRPRKEKLKFLFALNLPCGSGEREKLTKKFRHRNGKNSRRRTQEGWSPEHGVKIPRGRLEWRRR